MASRAGTVEPSGSTWQWAIEGPAGSRRMESAMSFEFTPRWKEELVCECAEGKLVVEITMGVLHVYFPSEARWKRDAPTWARMRYEEILGDLTRWCTAKSIPLTVDDSAWMDDLPHALA
jgi:hypothetical protein